MKNFGKLIFTLFLSINFNISFAQNFLETEIKPEKTYILLAHPTVQNLETIEFLLKKNILKIPDVDFVGIYSAAETYDYTKSENLIHKPGMQKFHLQKITGEADTSKIFRINEWTPVFKKLFNHSVGIFFFGGPDIQPEIYREKNEYSDVTDPNRHLFEASFLFHLLGGRQNEKFTPFLRQKPEYFVTGFCLGLQTMNVATGGTLIQDIPAEKYGAKTAQETVKLKKEQMHRNYWQEISNDSLLMGINFHHIQFTASPFFLKRVKARKDYIPLVLSSHHQSIDDLGKDLIVTATSMDGEIIEGIQHRLFPNVFAVQFHPEVPALYSEGKKLKFTPEDLPKSYYEIIGGDSREFHLKYWETISKALKASIHAAKIK